jgi:hypothetical protein
LRSRNLGRVKSIADFPSLVEYLREDLDWPMDVEDVEDLVFEYEPEELGLKEAHKVKINEIKQLRPLTSNQPWGIFYLDFEPKRLPVVVLRRILRSLVPKKRASAARAQQAVWNLNDLLFISALGEEGHRGISFAHFKENGEGPQLQTFSWDERETHFHYLNLNLERLRWPEDEEDVEGWREQWSGAFTTTHRKVIRTSKELSTELARFARHTRQLVREVYGYEAESGSLHQLHNSFRTVLIQDLDVDGFADMVAQTIAYGLFSARATGEEVLGLAHLEAMVPNTNPFLKELFAEFTKLSGHDKHQIDFDELGVSELVKLLNKADIEAILRDFGRQTGGGTEDPVIYFYELFLNEYDKQQRVKRGEFYTPKPVVSYIVRSVDRLLREELDCPDGLADTSKMEWNGQTWPKVMILDPATGTGTFLETVIEVIYETMTKKWQGQGLTEPQIHVAWNEYVPNHLLPRLHGFELMMAPYSVAHMKLGLKLKQTGYDFRTDKRLKIFLTNALEEPKDYSGQLFAEFLAHEAKAANAVKRDIPITVIIGNPPYANFGQMNRNPWILRQLQDYKRGLHEKKLNLDDDFIKFMRFGQWQIDRAGKGILAFITNNTYIDGITHRRMRESFLKDFTDVYVLDLHGSAKRREQAPEGGRDENVFDIQQGVAISILLNDSDATQLSRIHHYDLWGHREAKYAKLSVENVGSLCWTILEPQANQFFFVPTDERWKAEYRSYAALTEAFKIYGNGIGTDRDNLFYDADRTELINRMKILFSARGKQEPFSEQYRVQDSSSYRLLSRLETARYDESNIDRCLYRPFDLKWLYYDVELTSRSAFNVMRNLMYDKRNMALLVTRQLSTGSFHHVFVSPGLTDRDPLSVATRERTQVFPLYLYPAGDDLLGQADEPPQPNLAYQFTRELSARLSLKFRDKGKGDLTGTFGPEDVFHYAYGVFHSSTYRKRYAEFLKRDFPRLPLTTDLSLFSELCQWGEELVSLHLMRSPYLDNSFTTFSKSGSNVMEKAKYDPEQKRVYINKEQYFDNVPEETWTFRVGGYQVLDKWLKDRKGRVLSTEDIDHYRKIVVALHETRQIMQEIDEVIEAHGGWPLPGSVPAEAK